ncbi:hypothetical protein GWI33_005188 [Rhynchophorus ferrugineus]|uniref:Uncharacterized protein n=1 Tax=Rhynchophorus ferrugineus TaxID=354439 RepID=A0A834IKY8_RHYFE|nr:hypothetical protein GWI33_005188 [Rhynchophorus ferrugineus]
MFAYAIFRLPWRIPIKETGARRFELQQTSSPTATENSLPTATPIPESYTRKLEMDADQSVSQRRLFITSSGLDLQINDDTFQSGKAVLSCVSTLFNIYRGEKKEILEEAKEKPIPSSVLGPTDETSAVFENNVSIVAGTLFRLSAGIRIPHRRNDTTS